MRFRFWPLWIYIASYSNRYTCIFHKVYATNILFSPLHTTPFLHIEINFGVLHKHGVDITMSNTSCGSNPPHLQIGAFKSLQIQSVYRGVLSLIDLFCLLIFILSITEIIGMTGKMCINFTQQYFLGPLYEQAEFSAMWTLQRFLTIRVSDLVTLTPCLCKTLKYILTQRNGVAWSGENRTLVAYTLQKI